MKIKNLILTSAVFAALGLTSCSTYSLVNSQIYNNANLADYHTFRIISPGEESLPPGMDLVTYYNISAAIREQLLERGFQENPNSPIVVNIGLTINKEYQTTPIGALLPPPPPPIIGGPAIPPPSPAPGPGGPGGGAPAPAPGPGGPGGGAPGPGPGSARPGGPMPSEASQAINMPPAPAPAPGPAPAPAPSHFFPYNGVGVAPAFAPYFMMPRSYYWSSINPGTQVVTGIYKEGVLTMDIVNMSTKEALYSASVAAIIDSGDTQFRNLKGIAQAVQVLFSKFPVPLLPQYAGQK